MREPTTAVGLLIACLFAALFCAAHARAQEPKPAQTPLEQCQMNTASLHEQLWQAQTEAAIRRAVATGDVTTMRVALSQIAEARGRSDQGQR